MTIPWRTRLRLSAFGRQLLISLRHKMTYSAIKRLLKRRFPGKKFDVSRIAYTDTIAISWSASTPDIATLKALVGDSVVLYWDAY